MNNGGEMWSPERRDELLGTPTGDERGGPETGEEAATEHLMTTRAISASRARRVVASGRCDECRCALGDAPANEDCECPCHCACCCPPLAHCVLDCPCACACHYDISDTDDDGDQDTQIEAAQRTPNHSQADSGPAEGSVASDQVVAETPGSKQTDEDERQAGPTDGSQEEAEDMSDGETAKSKEQDEQHEENDATDATGPSTAAPSVKRLDQLQTHQLFALLATSLGHMDDHAAEYCRLIEAELFQQVYKMVLAGAKPAKTTNQHLPNLKPREAELMHEFLATIVGELKFPSARAIASLKDIARAATRSTWTAERIIEDRLTSARLPREPPTNVWKKPDGALTASPATPGAIKYQFNPAVYTPEQVERCHAVCIQEHVFGETTRTPTPDEWEVIMGLASGSIQAAATPQFLMRCCTMAHIAWIYEQIQATEGELWVRLPSAIKMYNYGQTTRRLAEAIRQSAAHQKWTDPRLNGMLSAVKSIAYSKNLYALHFYFFSKPEAESWGNMLIPFRTTKLKLVNPETKLRRSHQGNQAGLPTDDDDGLVNDRYQAQFQIRLLNLVRALPLRAIIAYLQKLTANGLKSVIPLDTYGQYADGSLMWDVYSLTTTCPDALRNIYRIDWDGHLILLQHNPEAGQQPCLQCARMGHQTANCTTPEAEWNQTTLTVTAEEIRTLTPAPRPWTTLEGVQAIFAQIQDASQPPVSTTATTTADDQPNTTDLPSAPANVPDNQAEPPEGPGQTDADVETTIGANATNPSPSNTSLSTPSQQWRTAKRTKRSKSAAANRTLPADDTTSTTPDGVTPANQTSPTNTELTTNATSPTPATPQTNRYINLVDSDDESSDSDYEDAKDSANDGQPPPPAAPQAHPTTAHATRRRGREGSH